jgi:hypothetical protein
MCRWSTDNDVTMNGGGRNSEGVNMNRFITQATNGLFIREYYKFSVQHKFGYLLSFHMYEDILT